MNPKEKSKNKSKNKKEVKQEKKEFMNMRNIMKEKKFMQLMMITKKYTVKEINTFIQTNDLHDIMTDEGRDKHSGTTARLYSALLNNSTLNFMPFSPVYMFHSRQDQTVPFINAQKAEQYFKGLNVRYDFGDYGTHATGCIRFILTVYKDLP